MTVPMISDFNLGECAGLYAALWREELLRRGDLWDKVPMHRMVKHPVFPYGKNPCFIGYDFVF